MVLRVPRRRASSALSNSAAAAASGSSWLTEADDGLIRRKSKKTSSSNSNVRSAIGAVVKRVTATDASSVRFLGIRRPVCRKSYRVSQASGDDQKSCALRKPLAAVSMKIAGGTRPVTRDDIPLDSATSHSVEFNGEPPESALGGDRAAANK